MTLIKSISGIRGTIGGEVGDGLTPLDIVRFTASYASFIRKQASSSNTIIIGRDARISGQMISNIVSGTLMGCGFDVLDIGLSTTPTVEVAVQLEQSAGGIIITASHNPKEWNALKLLNEKGEFLSALDGINDPESKRKIIGAQFIEEFEKIGVNIVIFANHMLRAAYPAMLEVAKSVLENGRTLEAEPNCMSVKEILEFIPGTK